MNTTISKLSVIKIVGILVLSALVILTPSLAEATTYPGWNPINSPTSWLSGILGGIASAISSTLAVATQTLNSILGPVFATIAATGLGVVFQVVMAWLFGNSYLCVIATASPVMPAMGITLGQVLCNITASTDTLPGLIAAIAYMIGLVCAVSALLKLKDHVLTPQHVPLSDSMKRFVAGGAFFALPIVTSAARSMISGTGFNTLPGYNVAAAGNIQAFSATYGGGYGLDIMLLAFAKDILQPLMILMGGFAYIAGLVLIVIGIGRMLQTAREGPRGPAGVGTIMTFVTAGILFSLPEMMGAFSASMFGDSIIETYPQLMQTTGDVLVDNRVSSVITAVTVFMFLVGWVSFIRGFFILRDVSEGNGQASLMASITHIVGGALAVNLGPVMNAVESTFGLTPYGVLFS